MRQHYIPQWLLRNFQNSTITADLPRRVPPPVAHALPAGQRCVGLLNGEASYPGKGCASDITGHYMAFVMADGTVRMAGGNTNNVLAMEGNPYGPQHLHYLVWDNRTNADDPVSGRPLYVVGSYDSVAMLTDDGDVVTWGHNGHGQQGRRHATGNDVARSIDASDIGRASGIPGRDVVKLDLVRGSPVSSSSLHALCRDGSLWAWGYGTHGNLAQGNTSHSYSPVRCKKTGDTPLTDVVEFWPGHGNYNACFALTRDGRLWAVGDNSQGKLGVDDGTNDKNLFTEVVGLPSGSRVKKVAPCGSSRGAATAVLLKDGTIWTAGYGDQGFHGNGATTPRHLFGQLPLPSGVSAAVDLWGGGELAQLWFNGDDGNTYACGYNSQGQLGIGSTTGTISTPTRVALPEGITARMISTGGAFAAAHYHSTVMLGSDGRVYTCGQYGQYGAWGAGQSTTPLQWPLPVPPDQWDAVEVVAHGYTSAAGFFVRLAGGAVWAAGRNTNNKLGVEGAAQNPSVMARVELY